MSEDTSLLEGFRYSSIPSSPVKKRGTSDRMTGILLVGSKFEPWPEFETLASRLASDLSSAVESQGCGPNNHDSNRCSGKFRNWSRCTKDVCHSVAELKLAMTDPQKVSDTSDGLVQAHRHVLQAISFAAKKLKPGWHGEVKANKELPARGGCMRPALFVFPEYIYPNPNFRDYPRPHFIINLQYPNRSNLLPERKRSSLALDYAEAFRSVQRKGGGLSYALIVMAKTLQYAMHTGTGYACLSNHNRAVFVKVTPHSTVLQHRVQVSREFKCDGELSILHGMLVMMVEGFADNTKEQYDSLQKYYLKLKGSEITRHGRLRLREPHEENEESRRHGGHSGDSGAGPSHHRGSLNH